MATPEHFTGRNMDGCGAVASTDATHIQSIVRQKMAQAERERRGVPEEDPRVGARSDGSFGLLDDHAHAHDHAQDAEGVRPLKPALKKPGLEDSGHAQADDEKDGVEEEGKGEPDLKRRVSKLWKSTVKVVRGPSVARGL